jgi:hypothetical protein
LEETPTGNLIRSWVKAGVAENNIKKPATRLRFMAIVSLQAGNLR